MKKHLMPVLCACIAIVSLISGSEAQNVSGKNPAVKKLRDLFFERDFSTGYETGQKLLKRFPNDDELRMWVVLNGARAIGNNKAALQMANEMALRKADSVPALIALATANSYNGKFADALKVAENAVKLAPDNEEVIFTYNNVIFRSDKYTDSVEWLDKNADKIMDKSRFYYSRALSNYQAGKKDS